MQDELDISNVEWQQVVNDIQESLEKAETTNNQLQDANNQLQDANKELQDSKKKLEEALLREIQLVVIPLLAKMIQKVDRDTGDESKHFEERKIKKSKVN